MVEKFKERLNDKYFIVILIAMAVSCLCIFFPIYKVSFGFGSLSVNYIYNDGKVADGIFVLGASIAALIILIYKKDAFAFIPLGIELLLLLHLYSDFKDHELIDYVTIWFWLMIIGAITATVALIVDVVNKNNQTPSIANNTTEKVVDATYEDVKEVSKFCTACGAKRTDDGKFCTSCGNKF